MRWQLSRKFLDQYKNFPSDFLIRVASIGVNLFDITEEPTPDWLFYELCKVNSKLALILIIELILSVDTIFYNQYFTKPEALDFSIGDIDLSQLTRLSQKEITKEILSRLSYAKLYEEYKHIARFLLQKIYTNFDIDLLDHLDHHVDIYAHIKNHGIDGFIDAVYAEISAVNSIPNKQLRDKLRNLNKRS